MTSRIAAADVAEHLTTAGHTNAVRRRTWSPGYRATQASPRTVRLWHDGPDEPHHLEQYAKALRAVGYTVTPEHPEGERPRLRITHP
ncbi:hypothetical protein [Streptomyces hygroscopicus]|uniref:hypothetical protein n=1 Tax=Streptomyces hygroscopicus TaxID=1912 RepID=UPI0033D10BBC